MTFNGCPIFTIGDTNQFVDEGAYCRGGAWVGLPTKVRSIASYRVCADLMGGVFHINCLKPVCDENMCECAV